MKIAKKILFVLMITASSSSLLCMEKFEGEDIEQIFIVGSCC